MNIDIEWKKDAVRRLYDERVIFEHEHCSETWLDGLHFGLQACGLDMNGWLELELELMELYDGLIQGEWE